MLIVAGEPGWRWANWFAWLAIRTPPADEESPQASKAETRTTADDSDFERFFAEHEPRVSAYLRRLLGNDESAYDISQETFLRAWQHFQRIRQYDRPIAWLLRVATHLALRHRQRRASPVGAAAPLDELVLTSGGDPAADIAEGEQVRQILRALTPKARALLLLRDVYGFTGPEAAEVLGISLAAARKLLTRARQQFRERYLSQEGR